MTSNQLQQYIRQEHLERVAQVAERIADVLAGAWRELQAPPRPAWIIVESRENTRTADRYMRFMPR